MPAGTSLNCASASSSSPPPAGMSAWQGFGWKLVQATVSRTCTRISHHHTHTHSSPTHHPTSHLPHCTLPGCVFEGILAIHLSSPIIPTHSSRPHHIRMRSYLVGVCLQGGLAVRFLDLILAGALLQPQHLIVVHPVGEAAVEWEFCEWLCEVLL